jgi:PKD domain/Cysteine-rich secretory protein family
MIINIKFRNFLLTLFLTLLAGISHATDTDDAYSYLNQLRQRADMLNYQRNTTLERSALNHAIYNATNPIPGGHYEQAGLTGFTGVEPKDRTANAGYRSLTVSENVSWDNDPSSTSKHSIDGLMSAIYHRFGFLTFSNNEVGVGISKITQNNAYVYNMGNSDLNALCQGVTFSGAGKYYYSVCQPDIKIEATRFESALAVTQGNNPVIVKWPTNDDNDVPPAFYEESPDPLPDYSVSGYPISVQFNPLSFTSVTMNSFRLFNATDNSEILPTRLLDKTTDPNHKFSELEFALFPLERLAWNTTYRVEVDYTSNTGSDKLVWQFKTRDVGVPLYRIQAQGDVLQIPSNVPSIAVYVPPTISYPSMGGLSYDYTSGMNLQVESIDDNTVKLNVSGSVGQQAVFTIFDGRTFTVQISSATPATNRPPVASFKAVPISLSVTLDASSSTDADGSIVNYIWNASNGLTANGKTASLNFTQEGSYTITLTVTDNQGATATSSQVLNIKSTVTPPTEPTDSRIKGISTRAIVTPSPDKFMIAGIYVQGTESKKVLVRATGKGLINQGVS